jgi:hypothetical protein
MVYFILLWSDLCAGNALRLTFHPVSGKKECIVSPSLFTRFRFIPEMSFGGQEHPPVYAREGETFAASGCSTFYILMFYYPLFFGYEA